MRPILFHFDLPGLGRVDFPAYYVLLLLGFFFAILLGQKEAKRRGVDPNLVIDLGIIALIAGIIGARILHVIADGYFWDYYYTCTDPTLTNWGYTKTECSFYQWTWLAQEQKCIPPQADCYLPFKFWAGGLAYYGGLLVAIPTCAYFVATRKFGLGNGADVAGISIPTGLIFGRLGCFLAGCCYGQVCDLPWAVRFPAGSEASKHQALLSHQIENIFPELAPYVPFSRSAESLSVHPTQLYEAIACALIVAYLYFILRKRQTFLGQLFWASLALYAVARFVIEFFRDDDRGALLGLSTSQLIAIPIFVVCSIALLVLPKRVKKPEFVE